MPWVFSGWDSVLKGIQQCIGWSTQQRLDGRHHDFEISHLSFRWKTPNPILPIKYLLQCLIYTESSRFITTVKIKRRSDLALFGGEITLMAAMQLGWLGCQSCKPTSVWIWSCHISVILLRGSNLRPLLGLLEL